MKIRTRSLEGYYGEQFAKAASLSPLINKLLSLDRISALRYLASSRRILFKHIEYFKNKNNSKKSIGNSELVALLNEFYFGKDSLTMHSNNKLSEEFNELVSIIQNTAVIHFLDKIEIPKNKRKMILKDLKKGYKVINTVYGSIEGGSLEKETNTLYDFISSEFEDTVNEGHIENNELSVGLIEKGSTAHEVGEDSSEDKSSSKGEEEAASDEMVLLTRKETAAIFGITLPTLAVWEKNGSIPKAIRTGSRVYFRKSEILEHLNSNKDENSSSC